MIDVLQFFVIVAGVCLISMIIIRVTRFILGTKLTRFKRRTNPKLVSYINALDTSPFFRSIKILASIFGFIVLVFTAYQINEDIKDRQDERAERREDSIERAWNRLLRQSAGNTGKGNSLTFLLDRGISVEGADLSCEALGRWDSGSKNCVKRVIFSDLVMALEETTTSTVVRTVFAEGGKSISFADADLPGLRIDRFILRDVDLSRAISIGGAITYSLIGGKFDGAHFENCSLRGSTIVASGKLPVLKKCEISDLLINSLEGLPPENLRTLSAWGDSPPLHAIKSENGPFGPQTSIAYDPDFMSKILLCEPLIENGSIVPLEKRPRLSAFPFDWSGGPLADVSHLGFCKKMSYKDAISKYPNAYAPISRSSNISSLQSLIEVMFGDNKLPSEP